MKHSTNYLQALPTVTVLSLFWGVNAVASRFGISQFDPYFFITLRLAIASLVFWPILYLVQGKLPTDKVLWKQASLSGILGVAIPIPTFILSLQYQSSGVASLYVITLPVMLVIAAHYLLPDEKMTRPKAIGVSLAIGGTLLLALRGESGLADVGRASPIGFFLVVGGLVFEVCNTMFVRIHMKNTDPMQVTAIRLLVATVVVFIITMFLGDFSLANVTRSGYLTLGYAALVGALAAQFLAFYVQRTYGATVFSLNSFLVPIFATVTGALWLGEVITGTMLVGMLLIGSGLYLINFMSKQGAQ
ncbi:MAG: DMT family transporter [Chloroflexota bacterium]